MTEERSRSYTPVQNADLNSRCKVKIGVYVLSKQAKQNYKKECYDVRSNAGMLVVCDILKRAGYTSIEYCSLANVHRYDIVLFSLTADCDVWPFLKERSRWEKGGYEVIIGGAGCLNVRPLLGYADYFCLGRAEGTILDAVQAALENSDCENPYVISAKHFSIDRKYRICQVEKPYEYKIELPNGRDYIEDAIGCNHRCLFCGYAWHRKYTEKGIFEYASLWNDGSDWERAMIDLDKGMEIDWVKLRTTAIDGMSERLRFSVNKRITRDMLRRFLFNLGQCEKPHQVKIYNIVGLPTETEEDWFEFLEDLQQVDQKFVYQEKQTCILLHNTPFRPMPATPLACAPMQYQNFRKKIAKVLGGGKFSGNRFYKGNAFWAVESMATESLPTVIKSAIIWRGTESDSDNMVKIARSKKFETADTATKQATLEKYFDVQKLFGSFTKKSLPTRYLETYCQVKKCWE